ncbi:MAG: hypothetical protein H7274_13135, partial [Rhodoferax sp.]|nr:hypothetical protein [Rhodoferax sp.]
SATRKYALDMEENELGARCVAAAICAPGSGSAVAAISISGPSQMMSDDTLARMGRVLAATAGTIHLANTLN